MIFNFVSLTLKFIIILTFLVIFFQSIQTQQNVNNSYYLSNTEYSKNIYDLDKELINFSKKVKYIREEVSRNFKVFKINRINIELDRSLIQVNSAFDELKLNIDFEETTGKVHYLDLRQMTKTQIEGAVAVVVQINWCSQQQNGYLSMGPMLSKLKLKKKEYVWNRIEEMEDFNDNSWTMFSIYNETLCNTQHDTIQLYQQGFFYIFSEGKSQRKTKRKQSLDHYDKIQKFTGRTETHITFIIKGYYIKQEIPKIFQHD